MATVTSRTGFVADARDALGRPGVLAGAEAGVPNRPGLYAIHGDRQTWNELGLGDPPDARPLYVGKAEDSLVIRDLKTHFSSDGRTGQSTVRRSFAALLHNTLSLRGLPRNISKPGYFSNFGLSDDHDEALTCWMERRLLLATWAKSRDCAFALKQIEGELLGELLPPLNLQGVVTLWTAQIKAARGHGGRGAGLEAVIAAPVSGALRAISRVNSSASARPGRGNSFAVASAPMRSPRSSALRKTV
jgi:hypothetical protein